MQTRGLKQALRHVLRFGGNTHLGQQDFCFYYMFETTFSGHNKIRGTQKDLGGIASEWPP